MSWVGILEDIELFSSANDNVGSEVVNKPRAIAEIAIFLFVVFILNSPYSLLLFYLCR